MANDDVVIRISAKDLSKKTFQETVRNVAGIEEGTKKAAKSTTGLGASFRNIVGGIVSATAVMAVARRAFSFIGDSAIGMNAQLETSTLQFETLMGSADLAGKHVRGLFEFAKKTPFETGPIIHASKMLQQFGGEALNNERMLTLIGDAAAATGAPIQDLGMWTGRLYAQLQAGKPFGEAAQRLTELAVLTPKARAEMEDLRTSGGSARDIFALFEGTLGDFSGAMEKQSNTWTGLTSTFWESVQLFIAEKSTGAFGFLKDAIGAVNDALADASSEGLDRVVVDMEVALIQLRAASKQATEQMDEFGIVNRHTVVRVREAQAAVEDLKDRGLLEAIKAGKDLGDVFVQTGRVTEERLTTAMMHLAEQGTLTTEAMKSVGAKAVELRERGVPLSEGLENIADAFARGALDGKQLAEAHDEVSAATKKAADAQRKAIEKLATELSQADLPGKVATLESAWASLDPEVQVNADTMERTAAKVLELVAAGADLPPVLWAIAVGSRVADDALKGLTLTAEAEAAILKALAEQQAKAHAEMVKGLEAQEAQLLATSSPTITLTEDTIALSEKWVKGSQDAFAFTQQVSDLTGSFGAGTGVLAIYTRELTSLQQTFDGLSQIAGGGLQQAFSGLRGPEGAFATGGFFGGMSSLFSGIAQAAGPIGAVVGGVMSLVNAFKNIGGPSQEELLGRDLVKDFEDAVIATLDATQLAEAGGERWRQVVIGVRDAYEEVGKDAGNIVGELWDAIKDGGPEAVRAIVADIQVVLGEAEAVKLVFDTTTSGLQSLVEEATRSGSLLPATLEPYLVTLEELGGLTEEDRLILAQMADDAHTDWRAMEAAAKEYGIELEHLGPAFDHARLGEAAIAIAGDFEMLTGEGADVNAVLAGMADEVQGLINDAAAAGVGVPAELQPIITQMIEAGLLTDAEGQKLTDLGQISFAPAIELQFQALIDKIEDLIDALTGEDDSVSDAMDQAGADAEAAANQGRLAWDTFNRDLRAMDWDVTVRENRITSGGGVPGGGPGVPFAHGTHGAYGLFGSGTPAVLHGEEAITPRRHVPALADDIARALESRLGPGGNVTVEVHLAFDGHNLRRLTREQFREIERAIGGGVIRIPARAVGDQVA